jgi:hypothetical protein
MEIVVVANGEEKILDAETYGVNESMNESQVLSAIQPYLNEVAQDIPFVCKKVVSMQTAVGESGMVEQETTKFYIYPSAPAGC